jgi:hypothetical protein
MKTMRVLSALAAGLLALVGFETSCSRSSASGRTQSVLRVLPPTEAAQLAAKLANDECERLYKRRPFAASQHPAVLRDGEYSWGGLDEGAPGGFSALATFGTDGSHPKVKVYFSTDVLFFPARPPDPPPPHNPRP